ncbi:MAG: hypothetical protein PUG48_02195 [Clostridia bacterium]|nr:hypothetical protein [Clostridia bacterium]
MDNKQQINIPKYIWIIAAILVVCIIFLIFVQVPFSNKLPAYQSTHASAVSQISQYNDYLARADEVQKSIDNMKKEYEKESDKLFVNAKKTSDDIRTMLKKLDYDLSTLSVQKGVADKEKRVSSTGDPLYSTVITFDFTATKQKMIETLKYFESESNGSYYISQLSLNKTEDKTTTDKTSETSVKSSAQTYDVSLKMNLYYFNPDAKVVTPSVSGASGASGASGTSSAASAA